MKRFIVRLARVFSTAVFLGGIIALVSMAYPVSASAAPKITMPLVPGFFNGEMIYYINTEASDAAVAAADGTTYVPRLVNAIGALGTADLYHVTNFSQPNILDSVPNPVGPNNTDPDYSPLWLIHLVTWQKGFTPVTLKSEADIQDAQSAGKVIVQATTIVVNCPVMVTSTGTFPGALEVNLEEAAEGEGTITLPLIKGFANGHVNFYISTDASDRAAAVQDGSNFVSKLVNLRGSGAEADLHPFVGSANPAQKNVEDSAPNPVGPSNIDKDYSPMWDIAPVTFTNQSFQAYPLIKSEQEIFRLAGIGQMRLLPEPGLIINCPIVRVAGNGDK
ncbi:MAG: hypothetical protein HYR79_02585 [Nitrospirae bacterium]|nr:hypothetical protein [Nitrospirota bacterium]